ncbi:hypothetical protein CABS01_01270 [Colletotrichum abscissum]|uniref:uncharacterized protein n=1 Tax=Colletotrichum abscissum TaxID=1671311 RepID=UPI0027D58515|nr:uncharacterized protein CABS01_01270 [Colletotrichum abscissum]KAK1505802.1 hypothetical protein CABS01_01270 [Colletotrichum abscissum]
MPMLMPMIRTIPHVPLPLSLSLSFSCSLFAGPVSYGNLYHNPVHGNHRRPQYLPYHPNPCLRRPAGSIAKTPLVPGSSSQPGQAARSKARSGWGPRTWVPQERVRIGTQQNVYFLYGVSVIAVQLQQGCISHRLMLLQGRAVKPVGFRHHQAHT